MLVYLICQVVRTWSSDHSHNQWPCGVVRPIIVGFHLIDPGSNPGRVISICNLLHMVLGLVA